MRTQLSSGLFFNEVPSPVLSTEIRNTSVVKAAERLVNFSGQADRLQDGPNSIFPLVEDFYWLADHKGIGETITAKRLREWADMYRGLHAALILGIFDQTCKLETDNFEDRVASLAMGFASSDNHIRESVIDWAKSTRRTNTLFEFMTSTDFREAGGVNCIDTRMVGGYGHGAAKLGDRIFIPQDGYLEVVYLNSAKPNYVLKVRGLEGHFNHGPRLIGRYMPQDANGPRYYEVLATPDEEELVLLTADHCLLRISASDGEIIWGPVSLPNDLYYSSRRRIRHLSMNSAHIAYSQVDSPIAGIFDSKTGNLLARINLSPGKLGWFDRYFRINSYHSPRINLTITSGGTLVAIDKSSGNVFAWDEPVKSPEKRRKLRKSASVLFEEASKRHAEKLVRLLVLFVIYFLTVPKNIMFYYILGVCALFVPFRFKQKRRAEQCLQDIVTAPDGSVILLYSTKLLISDKSVAKIRKSIILPTPPDSFSDMILTTGSQGDVVVCYERNSVCQAWQIQDGKIGAQWQTEGSFEVVLGDKSEIVTITSSCLLQAWKGRKDELKTIESFPVKPLIRSFFCAAVTRNPDGAIFAVTQNEKHICLWDLSSPESPKWTMDGSFHPSSPGPGFTRDGRFVVIPDYYFGGRFIFKSVTDGTESIREWTVRPGQQGNFFEQLIDVAGKQIGRLQSLVHGQLPVSPQYAGLDSLDIDTDSIGRAALECGARDVSFAFSSHKSPLVSTNPKLPHLLAVAGKQSDEIYGVVLFNLKTGTRIDFDQSQHQPLGIAVSDNEEVVVMYETELKLWKTNAKGTFECKTVATFSARPEGMRWLHDIPPNFLVCMSSGRVALVHQNLRLEIWDCLECRKVREWCLSGIHDGDSESTWEYAPLVAVTEDQRLLTATRFGRLDLWDLEKDSPVATASHFIGPSIRRSLRTIGDLAVFVGGMNRFTVLRLPKKDVCAEDRVDRSPSDQEPSAARPPSHADR